MLIVNKRGFYLWQQALLQNHEKENHLMTEAFSLVFLSVTNAGKARPIMRGTVGLLVDSRWKKSFIPFCFPGYVCDLASRF